VQEQMPEQLWCDDLGGRFVEGAGKWSGAPVQR
jgi:hypothetical protein